MQKKNILIVLVVALNIPENKKPANHAAKKSRILLARVVVLNILEIKKPANHAEKKHFVSASCRAQHPGKQEASKPCRNKTFC